MHQLTRFSLILAAAFAIAAAAAAQTFSGGSSSSDRASFVLCNGQPCNTGVDQTNRWIALNKGKLKKCYAAAKSPPLGSALVIDIRVNGASAFGTKPKLTIPNGSEATATAAEFDAPSVPEAALVRIDIVSVGSIFSGQDVSVVCKVQ